MPLLSIEEMVRQCTTHVKLGLCPFVEREMQAVYGHDWKKWVSCQLVAGTPHWDVQALLRTILDNWQAVFENSLPRTARYLVFELKDWRNHVAHEHEMTLEDTSRLLDTAARLLKIVGAPQAADVEALRLKALREVIAGTAGTNALVQDAPIANAPASRLTIATASASSPAVRQVHVAGAPSRQDCVARLSANFGADLKQRSGCCAFSADYHYGVCCLVSKEHAGNRFWWNLRERQLLDLTTASSAFVAFGCGSSASVISIPLQDFKTWLPTFNSKPGNDGDGWHIHILHETGSWWLLQTGRDNRINVTQYIL